jgi:hypothetical protein
VIFLAAKQGGDHDIEEGSISAVDADVGAGVRTTDTLGAP